MSIQKLRIYAMLFRLHELEKERVDRVRNLKTKAFLTEPKAFKMRTGQDNFSDLYDKKGKLFKLPKSKYHK
jgi:hypothetical protein